jgi:hypothetical protein
MRNPHPILGVLAAIALGACGSSTTAPATATTLEYTDPAGTGWRLVRSGSSTPTHLVLDLVGPTGTLSRGVGFNLQLPPEVKAVAFPSSHMAAEDAGVYDLANSEGPASGQVPPIVYPADYVEPRAFAAGVKPGNLLTVGIFQKDRRQTAKDSGVPLVRVALELRAGATPASGTALQLAVPKAKIIPDDIGQAPASTETDQAVIDAAILECYKKSRVEPITVALGTLIVR